MSKMKWQQALVILTTLHYKIYMQLFNRSYKNGWLLYLHENQLGYSSL